MSEGMKHDGGKPRLDLLDTSWLLGVGRVLTFGATKYAAHNWRKGIQLSRLLAAALRHIFAFLSGEDLDSETGECHLYHASCCLMFASEMWRTRPDMDDRFKADQPKKSTICAACGFPHRENQGCLCSEPKPRVCECQCHGGKGRTSCLHCVVPELFAQDEPGEEHA